MWLSWGFIYYLSNSSDVGKSCSLGALGQFSGFSVLCVMLGLLVVSREKVKPLKGTEINDSIRANLQVFCYDLDNCLSLGIETSSD